MNVRSVFASTTIGRKGVAKMCGLLDLPRPVGSKPCKCEIIMRNAAKKLTEITRCDNPDDIFVDDNHTIITKVAVTVDGTWQRRGHCSKIGVVFVISVITGEVLDYVVKSLVCHECIYHQNDNSESDQYKLCLTKRSAVLTMQVHPMRWKKTGLKRFFYDPWKREVYNMLILLVMEIVDVLLRLWMLVLISMG